MVASMRIMARMGKVALDRIGSGNDFVPGLHSLGDLSPERRFILHFPEEKLIWSIGSGLRRQRACSGRNASLCGSPVGWRANRAGWPSTC